MPTDLPTYQEYFEIGKRELLIRNSDIDPDEVDREGSDVNIILGIGSGLAEELTRHLLLRYQGFFLNSAGGEDLEKLAGDWYGITRRGATRSTGEVRFSRPAVGEGEGTIDAATKLQSSSGVVYKTLQDANFGAADLGPITVSVQSLLAGNGTKVDAGTITVISDPIFDSTIVVTNPEKTAGGNDQETDDEFRERIRQFFPNARRGTMDAIEYGALGVDGVSIANGVEAVDEDGIPARWVDLYISDADGESSQVMTDAVTLALDDYRAAGIYTRVQGGVIVYKSIGMKLTFEAHLNSAELGQQAIRAVVAEVGKLGAGGTLYVSSIVAAIRSIPGIIVTDNAIRIPSTDLLPASDQVPAANEIIRTRNDLVTTI